MITVMKKIKNIFSLLVVALVGLSLTACSNDDLGTNQYQGGVGLNAYGPNPVMRGGTLRFVGSNLDQIASVNIPGVGEITNIEVIKAGVPSEIRITIPKDGPTVGYVTLKTKTDQTITTKTQLEFIEGIEVTKIPEEAVMPGQTIRIEGDYLNLINSLAFADGVLVSANDFVEQDRYYIDVIVPEEAKTGKLELYTADLTVQRTKEEEDALTYQTIITEDALTVGLPSTSKIKSPRGEVEVDGEISAKAGETITLTGDYYNVISAVKFGDVEVSDFEVSKDGTTLTFTLPAEAPDGVFCLVCKSGEEVPVATLTTIKPTNCTATPNPVKALKALTISGQDMDVVTGVKFEGADVVTGDNLNVSADKVVVALVPETATEGNLQLVMANGATVPVAFTLVKPVATAYNVNSASAGGTIQITGTDLDLVKSVTFGEAISELEKDAVSADGTTFTVKVPMEGKSGKPKLNLANGTSVEAPELTIDEAVFCYITEMPEFDDDNLPEAGDLLVVPVANADKLTNVYINGTEVQFAYSSKTGKLTISLPDNAKASSTLKLVSSNDEIEYTISVKPNTEITTVIWTGSYWIDWGGTDAEADGGGMGDLSWGGYDWSTVSEGTDLVITFAKVGTAASQIRVSNGSWSALPGTTDPYEFTESGKLTVTLTQAMLDALNSQGGLVLCGQGVQLLKVALVEHIELAETIWKGSFCVDWGGNDPEADGGALTALSWGGYDWSTVKVGTVLTIHLTQKGSSAWQIRVANGSWAALPGTVDVNELEAGATSFSVTLTQAMIDELTSAGGLVVTGQNIIITKITIE